MKEKIVPLRPSEYTQMVTNDEAILKASKELKAMLSSIMIAVDELKMYIKTLEVRVVTLERLEHLNGNAVHENLNLVVK